MRQSIAVVIILFLLLAGCSPRLGQGQPSVTGTDMTLEPGRTIGQTFTARHAGLMGVEVYLAPASPGEGVLRLHLRDNPPGSDPAAVELATAELSVDAITTPGYYRFSFPVQGDSYLNGYYLELEAAGSGAVGVGFAGGDSYLDGALYQDGQVVDAQLGFRLAYDTLQLLLGLVRWAWSVALILLQAGFLFVLPGWALLAALWPNWSERALGEKLALAGGLSLAVYPVLMLWTDLVNLHLGSVYAWLPGAAAAGYLLWQALAGRSGSSPPLTEPVRLWWISPGRWPDLAFLAVCLMIVFIRFYTVRTLPFPMWGDSVHHTMIAQLLVDNRGLFDSWQPYADLESLTYHFGFHAAAAVFHWVSNAEVPAATLWTGQVLNILAVLAVYPLALLVGKNRWAGAAGVMAAGLLIPMPMFYTNWGRYTQLAGQAIIPAVIWMTWWIFQRPGWSRGGLTRALALCCLALGGLALTHYRVLIFAILFFPALLLFQMRRFPWKVYSVRFAALGIGGGGLFLPWFIHSFGGKIVQRFFQNASTPAAAVSEWTRSYNDFGDLNAYMPGLMWGILLAGLVWLLWRRSKPALVFLLWFALILLSANPHWIRLPGTGILSNFAVLIAIYLPVGVFTGAAAGDLIHSMTHQRTTALAGLCAGLIILAGFLGMQKRAGDLLPHSFSLAAQPDLRAARWLESHTPPEARLLVNSFFAYNGAVIVGSDAGWWLPLISHRSTSLPPMMYDSEAGSRPDYSKWINQLTKLIQENGLDNATVQAELRERGITHLYIGQQQGRVNNPEGFVFDPDSLLASDHFRQVYHQDRVYIFEIIP